MGNLKRCGLVLTLMLLWGALSPSHAQVRDSVLQFQLGDQLKKSAAAWNRGDIGGFLDDYLDSDDLTFISSGQILKGLKAVRQRYEARYGKDPQAMGRLSFSEVEVWKLGEGRALVVGRWHLDRGETTQPRKSDGVFSLVMVEVGKQWKIVSDHTSLADPS